MDGYIFYKRLFLFAIASLVLIAGLFVINKSIERKKSTTLQLLPKKR